MRTQWENRIHKMLSEDLGFAGITEVVTNAESQVQEIMERS